MRESESCKSAILDGALDGIITMDHSARVVDFNPAAKFREMTGYSSEELAEMTPADLDFAEDRAAGTKCVELLAASLLNLRSEETCH